MERFTTDFDIHAEVTRGVEADQVVFVAGAANLVEPDDGFDGLALGEIVAERRERVIGVLVQVIGLKPVAE